MTGRDALPILPPSAPRVSASMLAPAPALAPEILWLTSAALVEDPADAMLVGAGADLFELRKAPERYAALRCGALAMASAMREVPYAPTSSSAKATRRSLHAMGAR